jgi:hypothetical protein
MLDSRIGNILLEWSNRNFPFVAKREGRFITLYKYNLDSEEGDILLEDREPEHIFSKQFSDNVPESYVGNILSVFNKVVTKIKNNND